MSVFDRYELKARVLPAMMMVVPAALVVGTTIMPRGWMVVAATVMVDTGLAVPLAEFVRHRGRSAQVRLWDRWGGSPLASFLATESTGPGESARLKAVAALETACGFDSVLGGSAGFERLADTARLLVHQRTNNAVVAGENRTYGFYRNLYGVRMHALVVSWLSALALTVAGSPLAVPAALWGGWIVWLSRESQVRRAATMYASGVVDLIASHSQDQ